MAIDQIIDDGSIIGYEPLLEYKKDKNSTHSYNIATQDSEQEQNTQDLSQTLQGFIENLPSETLKTLSNVSETIYKLTDSLARMFNTGDWKQYNEISSLITAFENGDEEYAKEFVNYHYSDIKGSIIPELIWNMHETGIRIKLISDTLKELYYGSPKITLDETKALDETYISRIRVFETSGDIAKINYPVITHDAMLNRSTSLYAYSMNKAVLRNADIAKTSIVSPITPSVALSVSGLFKETNDEIDYRCCVYKAQQDKSLINNTLYNYYDCRKTVLDMISVFNECPSILLGRKFIAKQDALKNAIKEVNMVYNAHKIYLDEMIHLEHEKNYLKKIYANTSYN